MRRVAAIEAQVAGSPDEARAEMRLPEPIDGDAGEQGIPRVGDPRCQPPPALGVGGVRGEPEIGVGTGHRRHAPGRDDVARETGIAANLHVRHARLAWGNGIRLVGRPGLLDAQFCDHPEQPGTLLAQLVGQGPAIASGET